MGAPQFDITDVIVVSALTGLLVGITLTFVILWILK